MARLVVFHSKVSQPDGEGQLPDLVGTLDPDAAFLRSFEDCHLTFHDPVDAEELPPDGMTGLRAPHPAQQHEDRSQVHQ